MKPINHKTILERLIILNWVCLSIFVVVKFFIPDAFEIATNNIAYINFCSIVEQNVLFKYLLGAISSFITLNLIWLSMLQERRYKNKTTFFISLIIILVSVAIKLYNSGLGIYVDIIQSFIYPAILIGKPCKKYINILMVNAYYIVFLLVSMYIKNISILVYMPQSYGIEKTSIYVLDTYIMLILLYLYQLKRRENK